jgi:predicted NAD/FAD-binding protein
MKIAVIGSGIAGNTATWLLHPRHEITLFEAGDRVGGHTNTVDVQLGDRTWAVDTGFIVYNEWTYPNFIRILDQLGVATKPSSMSFSVHCERTGLEYCSKSYDALFAQRRNLLRPSFHRMLAEILRFNRLALAFLEDVDMQATLWDFLDRHGFSRKFRDYYIVPMMSAIWSADPAVVQSFPARHFFRFFKNHGLLSVNAGPQWRVIAGGSREYVRKMTASFADRIRLRTPVKAIRRLPSGVELSTSSGIETFDEVVIATHSDQALRMLADASPLEREILGAIPYQRNEAVLHRDTRLLPRRRRAWASWNYCLPAEDRRLATLTYNMNMLQGLDAPETLCVTLNARDRIDPALVIDSFIYEHPIFTPDGIRAQQRHGEISGVNRTHYCGAYWGYGFHEDGVVSAMRACEKLRVRQAA